MVTESTDQEIAFDEEKNSSHTARKNRLLWLGGIILLIGGSAMIIPRLLPIPSAEDTVEEISPLPVETITVTPESSYEVTRSYTGEIRSRRSSELGLEWGGQVTDIFVEEGDRVSAGDPIARLDTQNLEAQKRQLEAQRNRALAQLEQLETGPREEEITAARARVRNVEEELELLKNQRSRREFLYSEGAISAEQLDEVTSQEQALQARLEEAKSQLQELRSGTRPEEIAAQQATVQEIEANLEEIEINLNKSILTAPFEGIVSGRLLDEGTVVQTGEPVIQLIANTAPEARIGVPPRIAQQLEVGTAHPLRISSEIYQGRVRSILPEVSGETRTREVIFQLDSEALLTTSPGETVRLNHTQIIESAGYWVPMSALTQEIRGLWATYVVVPNEDREGWKVQQEAVEIIHQEENRAFVRGTLEPEAQIVSEGTHRLVPGQPVELTNHQ